MPGDRQYAKELVSKLMRDQSQGAGLRARCALAILTSSRWVKLATDAPAGADAGPGGGNPIGPGRAIPEGV